jgi:hypothetical protein
MSYDLVRGNRGHVSPLRARCQKLRGKGSGGVGGGVSGGGTGGIGLVPICGLIIGGEELGYAYSWDIGVVVYMLIHRT